LAGWELKYPDVAVTPVLADGGPARVLIEQASRAQLLVIGSRGKGEFAGLLLGSVSHAVLHSAPCTVAVVRPDLAVTRVAAMIEAAPSEMSAGESGAE
jgi:nucleotide-binding universal stress UspA family protein